MIHLTIRTAKWEGEDFSPSDIVIDERDISLGEALELVLGNIWDGISLANVASRLERTRVYDRETTELALFYEYYLGRSGQEYWDKMPETCYSYWYSFTRPERGTDEQWLIGDDWSDFMKLYDTLMVYACYFENSERMRLSSEVQRHIERRQRGSRPYITA